MAAAKSKGTTSASGWKPSPKKKRPGVHAKSKSSNSKNSKHYTKKYRGQGK
jgi:hypothetical protein